MRDTVVRGMNHRPAHVTPGARDPRWVAVASPSGPMVVGRGGRPDGRASLGPGPVRPTPDEVMAHSSDPNALLSWWRSRRFLLLCAAAGVVAVLVIAVGAMALLSPDGEVRAAAPAAAEPATPGQPEPPAAPAPPAGLPESTTHSTIGAAPVDPAPTAPADGSVVHPRQEVLVAATPGGEPFARVGPEQIGPTWLPVIAEQPGWVQVMLPSRPNGSVGWLPDEVLDHAVSPYQIRVHLGSMRLELFSDDQIVGEWTIGIGKDSAPTPTGRTFLLGSFTDEAQDYSPVILPLGTHSPTLDSFGGGPGTVAIHTWPTDDVFGTASSEGCIRVPPEALDQLTEVPLGTLVLIDEH